MSNDFWLKHFVNDTKENIRMLEERIDRLESEAITTCTSKKHKRRSNDIGLEVVEGGKGYDGGPFTKNNPPKPDTAPISEQ